MQHLSEIGLVLIDIQKGFADPYWGRRNNPGAESRMQELLGFWRQNTGPVFHVQHLSVQEDSPLNPKRNLHDFIEFAEPKNDEPVFQKSVNSGFIGTRLEKVLRDRKIREIVCVGFTTDHCVSTTVRMASNLGFSVRLSADALCTFDRVDHRGQIFAAEVIHQSALASLHQEFAIVSSQASLLEYLKKQP